MKKQLKTKVTVSELIHHFANRTVKTERSGEYSFDENSLFYDTRTIAKIISIRKKIVIIDNTFNRNGAFGNGHSWRNIVHAFSDEWTILHYDKPSIVEYNKKDLHKIYLYHIKKYIFQLVDKYASEREVITNSRAYRLINNWHETKYIFKLANKLNLSENKIKRHIYNEKHWSIIRYMGWAKSESTVILVDKPISFWLDPTKWHTEEERKILKFKEWKSKWIDKGDLYGKSYKEIYDNPTLKEEFETRTTAKLERLKREREEADRVRKLEREKDELVKIEMWKKGELSRYYSFWSTPVQLRLINENTEVETTLCVKVPISHAERLFKFFMKCIKENRTYISEHNNQLIDTIGVYKLKEINKNESGEWYLKAGCHTIYKDAIEDFVKRYNLNW